MYVDIPTFRSDTIIWFELNPFSLNIHPHGGGGVFYIALTEGISMGEVLIIRIATRTYELHHDSTITYLQWVKYLIKCNSKSITRIQLFCSKERLNAGMTAFYIISIHIYRYFPYSSPQCRYSVYAPQVKWGFAVRFSVKKWHH